MTCNSCKLRLLLSLPLSRLLASSMLVAHSIFVPKTPSHPAPLTPQSFCTFVPWTAILTVHVASNAALIMVQPPLRQLLKWLTLMFPLTQTKLHMTTLLYDFLSIKYYITILQFTEGPIFNQICSIRTYLNRTYVVFSAYPPRSVAYPYYIRLQNCCVQRRPRRRKSALTWNYEDDNACSALPMRH